MTHQDQKFTEIKQPLAAYDLENPENNITGTIKSLFIAIGGLILVLSIAIMLPMFLTYLSEGDTRAPSEIHATDTARKNNQNTYAK
jgi:flagellar basal body-associated protein FliL